VALATRAAHAPDAVQAAGPAVTPRRPRRRAESRPPGRRRPLLRRLRRVSTIVVLLVTLAFLGSAAYLALQSIYFVGTNSRGLVTLYNGLPYRLPFGIALYTTTYVSGVSAATIPPERRRAVLDNSLRSESQAADLIRSLELGQPE
jgi:hypothetical protein